MMSDITTLDNRTDNLYNRISELIEQSRRFAVNAVNVAEIRTRFEVGRYIFEDEQRHIRSTGVEKTICPTDGTLWQRLEL